MREALTDPELLGGAIPGESWAVWRALLIAAMGEALTDEERVLFREVTGRETEPGELVDEIWAVVGRRGGKTRAAGCLSAYIAALCDHSVYLAPGERGVLPILAASTTQAGRAFQHARGIIEHSPVLCEQLQGEPTADTIRLATGVDIEVRPANYRTIRGVTAVAAICDELAFWMVEGTVNPDTEILAALRPSLLTTGGPLFVISSPYGKKGELYATFKRDYGPEGDPRIIVAKGASKTFNPTLSQREIDRAYARDASAAASEYGGEWRNDIEALVDRDVVEACVEPGVIERPYNSRYRYFAFVDPSGGGLDAMTMAIGHVEGETAVIDLIRERKPPFSPESVVAEFAEDLRVYGLFTVQGDRYAGEWPREAFKRHGITYELAEESKSTLYQNLLPLLNSRRVVLTDSPVLVAQIANLERRVARGGRESIDHPPRQHDDLANAVAGVAGICIRRQPGRVVVSPLRL